MHETTPVPTDGSEGATAAAEHATSLAGTSDATRRALRVVDVRTSPVSTETDRDEVVRSLEQSGERPTAPIPDRTEERDTPTTEAIRPEVPRGARERVDDHDADLVVGTHGRTGLERTLPGSATERIVRTVDVPVPTVRPDASGAPGRAGTRLRARTPPGNGHRDRPGVP
jgi:nucleotide-binding universal stress UspA family protein